MDQSARYRAIMAVLGGMAAYAVYQLIQLNLQQVLQERELLAAITLLGGFSSAVMLMTGPVTLRYSILTGAVLALVLTGLVQLAAQSYVNIADFAEQGLPLLHILVLIALPLPFLIASYRGHWSDYDLLFQEAWAIVLRVFVAAIFVGVVWLLVFLCNLLLSLVGVTVIETLLTYEWVPFVITGAAGGFGLAVVQELSDVIGLHLVLRLMRLLLPLTLIVVVVFLVALPFKGLADLFGGLSVGFTLLATVAVGASLVSSVVDQRNSVASTSRFLLRATRLLSLLLLILAGLGAVAVGMRIWQYGWTPERLFSALIAVLALGYGGFYATAMGLDWMARIRRANVKMALLTIALAALSLTPVLDANRISTNSQMARFNDGRLPVANLDIWALKSWGVPGAAALAQLQEQAKLPDQGALAAQLILAETPKDPIPADAEAQRAVLAKTLPIQPENADKAAYIAAIDPYILADLVAACAQEMPTGGKGCVLVTGDFVIKNPGVEAVVVYQAYGNLQIFSLPAKAGDAAAEWRVLGGELPTGPVADALIRRLQSAAPILEPVPLRQLNIGGGLGVVILQ